MSSEKQLQQRQEECRQRSDEYLLQLTELVEGGADKSAILQKYEEIKSLGFEMLFIDHVLRKI